MKKALFHLITVFALLQCTPEHEKTVVTGPYLGQQIPGSKARMFAPGIISTELNDRDLTFSQDGNEIIFGVIEKPHFVIVSIKREKEFWTAPKLLPFSGSYNDCEPHFTSSGNRLYFCSDRPLDSTDAMPKDYDIWYVEWQGGCWGIPVNLGPPVNTPQNEFYPSLTRDGVLYYTSYDMKILRSRPTVHGFSEPEILNDSINSGIAEYNAFVSPNENYLIFTSHGWPTGQENGGDLFISYAKGDSGWTTPINLGPDINSQTTDMSPTVTADGKYLFFSSRRPTLVHDPQPIIDYSELFSNSRQPGNGKSDIYWVETSFIDSLRAIALPD